MRIVAIIVIVVLIVGLLALCIWQGTKLVKDIIAFVRKKKEDKNNKNSIDKKEE